MALVFADRVKVRSYSTGTAEFLLESVQPGFQDFSAIGDGNECYYGIEDHAGNWEVGRGTYSTDSTQKFLYRDTIISSSNNNNLVNFPAGGKSVYTTIPSSVAASIVASTTFAFRDIAVAGQSTVIADSTADTLTLVAGTGIDITTNAGTDTITITGTDTGAIEFTGSTITTNDSSNITIDRATTLESDVTVGGDILPKTNLGGNLGSPTQRFKDIYLSGSTIDIAGATISNVNGAIATSSLNIGGVTLESTSSGSIVIPGVTRASSYIAQEVVEYDDEFGDGGYVVPDSFTGSPVVVDGLTFQIATGAQVPDRWVQATYRVTKIEDGEIKSIEVVDGGAGYEPLGPAPLNAAGEIAYQNEMMACNDPSAPTDPSDPNFLSFFWEHIPFRVISGPGAIESDPTLSGASLGNLIISDNTESNNESVVFTTSVQGSTISIRNTETAADQFDGDIIFNSEPHPGSVIGSGGYVRIAPNRINLDVGSNDLNLRSDGLDFDGGYALTQTQGNFVAAESTDVVFEATDTAGTPKVIKLIIKVNKNDDYQACEMLIVRSNDVLPVVNYTVYGLVHTTAEPFATLAAEWSTLLSKIVVTATNPSATDGIFVESMAIEITDWD